MSRQDDINILYSAPVQNKALMVFNSLYPHCRLLQLLSIEDIMNLNAIAKDKALSARPVQKFDMIKNIMANRGFKKLASGTNRIVFKFMEDQSFVIKVAFDSVGLSDNLNELYNQEFLRPFCTKVYEVSPCGTVGMFERVIPIRNRNEFQLIASDVFDIIVNHFIGRYILNDFGTKYFMNWGIRQNVHPVILDFPYVYELDGAKIFCNRPDPMSEKGYCGGEIDYDDGFNMIHCKKCGKKYLASELKLAAEKKSKNIIVETEEDHMVVNVLRGDQVIQTSDRTNESRTYKVDSRGRRKETPLQYRERKMYEGFKVNVVKSTVVVDEQKPISQTAIDQNAKAKHDYDAKLFNNGYDLSSVPSVKDMYADGKIKVTNRKGEVVVDEKKEEEERTRILENTFEQNPVPTPVQSDADVAEPYYANDNEEDQGNNEAQDTESEEVMAQYEEAQKRAQAEAMINIIPREPSGNPVDPVGDEDNIIANNY